MRKKNFPKGKIKLNDGMFYEYEINEKQKHIAKNIWGKILVNQEFERLKEDSKKTIYYHEKQHSEKFNVILGVISISLAFILIFFSIFLLTVFSSYFYPISKVLDPIYFSFLVMVDFLLLIIFILINYLDETICDVNAVKNMGVKNFNDSIIKYYKDKGNNDCVYHPHWKLRKKIIESFD